MALVIVAQGHGIPLRSTVHPQRPTLATIAKVAQCSTMTVSLALRNDKQLPLKTRERIQRIAAEVGYAPDGEMAVLMARVRSRGPVKHVATIGVLHMVERHKAAQLHCYTQWRSGAAESARVSGYMLDDFWVGEDGISAQALERMLHARNITALLVLWPAQTAALDQSFHALLEQFTVTLAGYPCGKMPHFPLATNDRFATGFMLARRAHAAGYRRIGTVLHHGFESRDDARFASGIESALTNLESADAPAHLHCGPDDCAAFHAWLARERPDCVISTTPVVSHWLDMAGIDVPGEVGFLFSRIQPDHDEWSGTRQNDFEIGAAAVEMLTEQLRRGRYGIPLFQRRMLIESTEIKGRTVRG